MLEKNFLKFTGSFYTGNEESYRDVSILIHLISSTQVPSD